MRVGWWTKAAVQAVLAKAPQGHRLNHILQHARGSHRPQKTKQRLRWMLDFHRWARKHVSVRDAHVVEIGTGWDGLHPALLALFGAKRITTFDHVAHLRVRPLRTALDAIAESIDAVADVAGRSRAKIEACLHDMQCAPNVAQTLAAANIDYRAPASGEAVMADIQDADIFCSYAVLAHIPENQLGGLHQTARRMLRPGGVALHHVGLQDPFNDVNGGDNFQYLAYEDDLWRTIGDNSIASNNRLRVDAHARLLAESGLRTIAEQRLIEPGDLERARAKPIAKRFSETRLEDLAVTTWRVVAEA
jgi:hypothetical protein